MFYLKFAYTIIQLPANIMFLKKLRSKKKLGMNIIFIIIFFTESKKIYLSLFQVYGQIEADFEKSGFLVHGFQIFLYYLYFWKCNFPMIPHVCRPDCLSQFPKMVKSYTSIFLSKYLFIFCLGHLFCFLSIMFFLSIH